MSSTISFQPKVELVHSAHVFNVQRFCSDDGPGIRTTVFLKGCPLRCSWCHNPESQLPLAQVSYDQDRCLHCGACSGACPKELISPDQPFPNQSKCDRCGSCVTVCPTDARKFIGESISVGEVIAQIIRDRPFYDESGGGVTFSGGEPMTHPRYLLQLVQACKKIGISTVIDTCGFARKQDFLMIQPYTDLFLYDLKQMDDERHRKKTGVSNERILENLVALAEANANVWIRIPFIPGFNDSDSDLHAFGCFISLLPKQYPVWLLPYHQLGRQKHLKLGMPEPASFREPEIEEVLHAAEILQGYGLDVHLKNKS